MNTRDAANGGRTLLMAAAIAGSRGICKRLLKMGADPQVVDDAGRSAADSAIEYRHYTLADELHKVK